MCWNDAGRGCTPEDHNFLETQNPENTKYIWVIREVLEIQQDFMNILKETF